MKLMIHELELLFKKTIVYLEEEKIQHIYFTDKDNYYFKIWQEDIQFNNPEFIRCPAHSIGSLDDDIGGFKDVFSGRFGPCNLDLDRLGAILTTIGELLDAKVLTYTYCQTNQKTHSIGLSLGELKLIFKIMLVYLAREGVNEIFFQGNRDYYCTIFRKNINFNDMEFLNCPPYTIGSLTSEICDLKKMLTENLPMDAGHLQKLGAILTALGQEM